MILSPPLDADSGETLFDFFVDRSVELPTREENFLALDLGGADRIESGRAENLDQTDNSKGSSSGLYVAVPSSWSVMILSFDL